MDQRIQLNGTLRHLFQSSSASRFTAGASRFLNPGVSNWRPSLRSVPRRMWQGTFVIEDVAEITAIDPTATGRAPDEVLGLALRGIAQKPPQKFATRNVCHLAMPLLTLHCRSLGAMRRVPELWFKYNILTKSTRLPFSVAEHAAFSLPRVILASRLHQVRRGGHVHGQRISCVCARLLSVGRQGSDRRAARAPSNSCSPLEASRAGA